MSEQRKVLLLDRDGQSRPGTFNTGERSRRALDQVSKGRVVDTLTIGCRYAGDRALRQWGSNSVERPRAERRVRRRRVDDERVVTTGPERR